MDGYTKVPNDLIRCPHLTPAEKAVWMLIASMDGRYTYTAKQASDCLGITARTWTTILTKLEGKRLIRVERHLNGNHNRYEVVGDPNEWVLSSEKNGTTVRKKTAQLLVRKFPNSVENISAPHLIIEKTNEKEKSLKESAKGILLNDIKDGNRLWVETMMMHHELGEDEVLAYAGKAWDYVVLNGNEPSRADVMRVAYRKAGEWKRERAACRPLSERKTAFWQEIVKHRGEFGEEMLTAFYAYYKQVGDDGLMLFERSNFNVLDKLQIWRINERAKRNTP